MVAEIQAKHLAEMRRERDTLNRSIADLEESIAHPYKSDPIWFKAMCGEINLIALADKLNFFGHLRKRELRDPEGFAETLRNLSDCLHYQEYIIWRNAKGG